MTADTGLSAAMCKPMEKNEKIRRSAVLGAGACVYALLFALGSQVDAGGVTQAAETMRRFALALLPALGVLYALWRYVMPRLEVRRQEGKMPKVRFAFGVFAFLVCCYVPLMLVEYPGSFMYDTQRQVFQIARNEYEMFHPLAHTLLIRVCLSLYDVLNSFEKCAAVYSLVQILLVAFCFSQVTVSVRRMCGKRASIMTALFFGLYPAHMAFASNCTKDGLFSAFFALFFALCMEEIVLGGMHIARRGLWLAAGVLMCLMRNNMIYAAAAWVILLIPFARRFWRAALCTALAIVLSLGVNAGLQRATNAKDGSKIEMLSVPIQQLSRARLYAPECFTEDEKALMDLVFVDAIYDKPGYLYEQYTPTLADPVKNYLDEALVMERFDDLARMWLNVGRKCPGIYLDAFLNLALPSLYPYSEYRVAQPYIEVGIQPGVVTAPFGQPPMMQPGRFEGIRNWIYEHIYSTGMDDVPVLRLLFNTGFIYWVLLMIVLYELYSGNGVRFMLLLLPVMLWGTYLLGPVMQGRYLYPFICVLPLFALRLKKN